MTMEDDLLSEASGSRVLTARHIISEIISEKAPAMNDAINTTVLCHNLSLMPDFYTYYNALQPFAWLLWSCGILVLATICGLFVVTLRSARRHWGSCGSNLVIVLSVYPLVAAAGLVVLVIPRARLLAEAAAQQAVMIAMYHFFCLLISESGGVDKLVRRGSRLESRVPPCCCWPCCVIPRPILDKQTLSWLRCLVLQLPVVQGTIYLIILIFWAEDLTLYMRSFVIFQPFVIGSILTGVWGIIMMVKTVEATGLICRPRFLAVQLVLIVVKAQCGIAKVLPDMFDLPCVLDLNPAVVVHMIQYSIMMIEMLALSLWAWRLYQTPPEQLHKVQQIVIAVLEEGNGDYKPKDVRLNSDMKL